MESVYLIVFWLGPMSAPEPAFIRYADHGSCMQALNVQGGRWQAYVGRNPALRRLQQLQGDPTGYDVLRDLAVHKPYGAFVVGVRNEDGEEIPLVGGYCAAHSDLGPLSLTALATSP
jgi:hypothetical protein